MEGKIISKNLMEELVDIYIDDCIDDAGMCDCPQCRADVRAYALNHLPPRYVVTTAGDIYVRVNAMTTQAQANIITAIMKGINLVKRNPRHTV